MRVLRTLIVIVLALGVLGALALLGWATHHPDHPRLHAAREWPVAGPWVVRFQRHYLGPEETGERVPDEGAPSPPNDRDAAPARSFDARPSVWVQPDLPLYREPSHDADVELVFDRYANLSEIESRDGWTRVRYRDPRGRDRVGWLAPRPDEGPILGRATVPVGPVAAAPASPAQIESARAQLGMSLRTAKLGPYDLLTDSRNQVLIDRLRKLAAQLDDVFARRFGLRPIGRPAETVVLFETLEGYRGFKNATARIAHLNAAGHAERGMAALYRGEQNMDDVAAVFVHEISHLISRRAIGPALPLWLGEGIAEALSSSRLLPWGGIDPEGWGGSRLRVGNRITSTGEWSARQRVKDRIVEGTLPPLDRVIGIDDDDFQNRSPAPGLHYTMAGTFVRFLLDGAEGRHRQAFQAFLRDISEGGDATAEALIARLGASWDALDREYRSWMSVQGEPKG